MLESVEDAKLIFLNKVRMRLFSFLFLPFVFLITSPSNFGSDSNPIVIGSIEGSLSRKQIPVDLGKTSKAIASRIGRAIELHGGLRLSPPSSSLYSLTFTPTGSEGVRVQILKGNPKSPFANFSCSKESLALSIAEGCDKFVEKSLGIPGFFSGQVAYLSALSGNKEVFISDAMMSSARPQTSFKKITFNPSWANNGSGVFFTSNRQVFNNIYFLSFADRKISTIAKYRGSNLSAVQNPRSSQIALILSTSGNPELWISSTPKSKPSRLTRNKSNESGPTWSPDGRRILLTSDARGKPQIYEVSISTGILTRIPTNVSSHCTEPAWNPRYPNKFAFTAAISGGFQVCEYDFDARKTKILTKGTVHHMQPCWANDGRHIFLTQRTSTGATRIMLLDTEFDEAKAIPLHNENFGNCSQVSFYYPN